MDRGAWWAVGFKGVGHDLVTKQRTGTGGRFPVCLVFYILKFFFEIYKSMAHLE